MQSLLSSPDYFHCDHYHATLPMATCVARRRAKHNGGLYGYNGYTASSYPACQECEQGRDIERRYAEMAKDEQPCGNCHRKVRTLFDGLCGYCDDRVKGCVKGTAEYAWKLTEARAELSRTLPGKKNQQGERSCKGVGARPNGGRGTCRNCQRENISIKQDDLCGLCFGRVNGLEDADEIREALVKAKADVENAGKAIRVKPEGKASHEVCEAKARNEKEKPRTIVVTFTAEDEELYAALKRARAKLRKESVAAMLLCIAESRMTAGDTFGLGA